MKKPKIQKLSRKKLVKELDKWFSLYIRKRDKYCVLCGTTENLTCGHLFSRVAYSTRWDETNAFGQCAGCNMRHEHDPARFHIWFINKYGKDKFESLHWQYNRPMKTTNETLIMSAIYFKQQFDKLK